MEASWQDLAAGAAALVLGTDGHPARPLVLLDLDALGAPPAGLRPPAGAVVVGVTDGTPPTAALAHLTCWASPDEVGAITSTVAGAPTAAVVLAQLLAEPPASHAAGLVVESLAYSTLLAGAEFRGWLAGNRAAPSPDVDPVQVARDGNVLTLTLNRPERHNAYSAAMRDALRDGLAVAIADPAVEVVLRGNGPSFCSGGDLAEFGTTTDPATAHLVRTVAGAGLGLDRLRARTRARVHGACVGAGIELAAFAGHLAATDDAWFQLPELGMGLVPGAGGTVSLPARIGRWRTAQLALTQQRLDVGTAITWGLVDAPSE